MTISHTPGPWEKFDQSNSVQSVDPEANGKCRIVYTLGPDSSANARLIAASPDMLAALEGMVNHFGVIEDNEMLHPVAVSASKAVRAAIAKAKGES